MKEPISDTFVPTASDLGSLIRWLHKDLSVTAPRLAALFGTSPGNIRVIASRGEQPTSGKDAYIAPVAHPHTESESKLWGVRFQSSAPERKFDLGEQQSELSRVVQNRRSHYQFLTAIGEIKALLPGVGNAGHAAWIAHKAEIHHQMSWFYCHLGMSRSAIAECRRAMSLFRIAFHESDCQSYALSYMRAALPGSNAALLARRPEIARSFQKAAEAVSQAMGFELGADHHRQAGVALFQLNADDAAKTEFERAALSLHDQIEAPTPATARMASSRHLYFLGSPNYEGSAELRQEAGQCFGTESLEYSMATNWTAAAALATGNSSLQLEATEMLDANRERAARFGHQATITLLLRMTPELNLNAGLRASFIRRALYENTQRKR